MLCCLLSRTDVVHIARLLASSLQLPRLGHRCHMVERECHQLHGRCIAQECQCIPQCIRPILKCNTTQLLKVVHVSLLRLARHAHQLAADVLRSAKGGKLLEGLFGVQGGVAVHQPCGAVAASATLATCAQKDISKRECSE